MDLTFQPISKNDQGEYSVRITREDGKPVFHQLNNVALSLDESAKEMTIRGDVSSLLGFDEAIMEYAKQHSSDWFGRKVADGTLAKAYQGQVEGEDSLVADMFEGARYYSQDKEIKDSAELSQDDLYGHVIVELHGLWFVKKNFGPVWRLVQVKDAPPPPPEEKSHYDEYLFQDD